MHTCTRSLARTHERMHKHIHPLTHAHARTQNGEKRRSRFLIEEVEDGNGNRTFGDPLRSTESTNVYDKFAYIDEDEVNAGVDSSLEDFINSPTSDGGKFAEEDVTKRNSYDNEKDDFTDVVDDVYDEDGGNACVKDAVRGEFVATRRASSVARSLRIQTDGRRPRSIIEDLMKVYMWVMHDLLFSSNGYNDTGVNVIAHPTTVFSVVTRLIADLDGSCRARRFLQSSTVLAELDGSCRTRRFLQSSTVLAELDGSCRTRRFLQSSTVLAELDGSCRTRRFLQTSTVLAGLGGSCRTRRFLQNSTVLAQLDGSCTTRRFLQDSTAFSYPFWPLRRLILYTVRCSRRVVI